MWGAGALSFHPQLMSTGRSCGSKEPAGQHTRLPRLPPIVGKFPQKRGTISRVAPTRADCDPYPSKRGLLGQVELAAADPLESA